MFISRNRFAGGESTQCQDSGIFVTCTCAWCPRLLPKTLICDPEQDNDSLALHVLKAVIEPLRQNRSYSFRALISRDSLGSDRQIITMFHVSDATLEEPNELQLNIKRGAGQQVKSS